MYAITGATGQLGRLVIQALLKTVPPEQIVALARDPSKATDLSERGVIVRHFDYDQPDALAPALENIRSLLFISSSALGARLAQHRAVIKAAEAANVEFVAYTSLLFATSSSLNMAYEHVVTEGMLRDSGIPHALLRNSFYNEVFLSIAAPAIQQGVIFGSWGQGRIASASCADYADAAAVVLTDQARSTRTYELAGDTAFTMAEFTAELARSTGKPIVYKDLPKADYRAELEREGIPAAFAEIIADNSAGSAKGALYDNSHTLSRLIGRATTPIAATISKFLS